MLIEIGGLLMKEPQKRKMGEWMLLSLESPGDRILEGHPVAGDVP